MAFPTLEQLTGMNPAANAGLSSTSLPMPGLSSIAPSAGAPPFWSPHSALFWFGAVAAATIGLIAASTDLRVGTLKVSASAGS
jgi:hypothetical protein